MSLIKDMTLQKKIEVDGHNLDSYITGEKYDETFKEPQNVDKERIKDDNEKMDI